MDARNTCDFESFIAMTANKDKTSMERDHYNYVITWQLSNTQKNWKRCVQITHQQTRDGI